MSLTHPCRVHAHAQAVGSGLIHSWNVFGMHAQGGRPVPASQSAMSTQGRCGMISTMGSCTKCHACSGKHQAAAAAALQSNFSTGRCTGGGNWAAPVVHVWQEVVAALPHVLDRVGLVRMEVRELGDSLPHALSDILQRLRQRQRLRRNRAPAEVCLHSPPLAPAHTAPAPVPQRSSDVPECEP